MTYLVVDQQTRYKEREHNSYAPWDWKIYLHFTWVVGKIPYMEHMGNNKRMERKPIPP